MIAEAAFAGQALPLRRCAFDITSGREAALELWWLECDISLFGTRLG
jgi:hypothetical protein